MNSDFRLVPFVNEIDSVIPKKPKPICYCLKNIVLLHQIDDAWIWDNPYLHLLTSCMQPTPSFSILFYSVLPMSSAMICLLIGQQSSVHRLEIFALGCCHKGGSKKGQCLLQICTQSGGAKVGLGPKSRAFSTGTQSRLLRQLFLTVSWDLCI